MVSACFLPAIGYAMYKCTLYRGNDKKNAEVGIPYLGAKSRYILDIDHASHSMGTSSLSLTQENNK